MALKELSSSIKMSVWRRLPNALDDYIASPTRPRSCQGCRQPQIQDRSVFGKDDLKDLLESMSQETIVELL
jgi:hypothetical protein